MGDRRQGTQKHTPGFNTEPPGTAEPCRPCSGAARSAPTDPRHGAHAVRAGPLTPRPRTAAQTRRAPAGTPSSLVSRSAPRNAPSGPAVFPCSSPLASEAPQQDGLPGWVSPTAPAALASPKPALLAARDARPQCGPLVVSGHGSQVPEAGGRPAPPRGRPVLCWGRQVCPVRPRVTDPLPLPAAHRLPLGGSTSRCSARVSACYLFSYNKVL